MGSHPINLAVRFLLEIIILVSFAMWGWNKADGLMGLLLAIILPVSAAVTWGVFAVPDDPSRSGKTIVAVSGILRLIIELGLFGLATKGLYDLGYTKLSIAFSVIVVMHYLVSYDRIFWLIKQ